MKTIYAKHIQIFVIISLLIGSTPIFAQVYATSETNGTGKGCKGCSVINSELAVDEDLNSFSTLTVNPKDDNAITYQHYTFPKTSLPGSYLLLVIENNSGGSLNEKLLESISVRTYVDGKSNKDKKVITDFVLTPIAGSSTKYSIMVFVADAFNEARFTLSGDEDKGLVSKLNIYYVMYTDPTSLPVTLVSFIGENINSTVELKWSTSSETDNKNFIIERSADAIQFEKIATIEGKGTNSDITHYFYSDNSPVAGSNFYRLKSIDNNGGSHYYQIIEVVNNGGIETSALLIGSNPFQESLKVYFETSKAGNATIQVIDFEGAEKYVSIVQTIEGSNAYTIANLENFKSGVYSIIIRTENGVFVEKVIKM